VYVHHADVRAATASMRAQAASGPLSGRRYETIELGSGEVRLWPSHRGARCQLAVGVFRREVRFAAAVGAVTVIEVSNPEESTG
jgi:hypothetical protein